MSIELTPGTIEWVRYVLDTIEEEGLWAHVAWVYPSGDVACKDSICDAIEGAPDGSWQNYRHDEEIRSWSASIRGVKFTAQQARKRHAR